MQMEKQQRRKYTEAMIKKLSKKNQKYYVLDSEVIGLRIYVQVSEEKSFYLQRYIKEFKYSKKTKIGDWPEMSMSAARKLAALIKADNVQGKDPIVAATARAKEKTLSFFIFVNHINNLHRCFSEFSCECHSSLSSVFCILSPLHRTGVIT